MDTDNDLRDFITASKTFNFFCFFGSYNMAKEDFISMFKYFCETGINLLDDYSNMVYLVWDANKLLLKKQIDEYEESQSRLRRSGMFDYEWLSDCRRLIKTLKIRYNKHLEYISNKERKIASRETSKLSVRNQVFAMHGDICLCCGSTENIQIDHIIPVYKGGKNKIENYQPLCKTCNVKKGTKIIDYRIKKL